MCTSLMSGEFTRDYVSPEDKDVPAYNVFARHGGLIRHFYAAEMGDKKLKY